MKLFHRISMAQKMYGEKTLLLRNVWIVYVLFLQPCSSLNCPSTIQNGSLNSTCSYLTGSNCSFTCNLGFTPLAGENTLHCGPDGNWTPSNPCIVVSCPKTIPNGNITEAGNCSRMVGATCEYKCNRGFRKNPGASALICQANGTWLGDISNLCQEFLCPAIIPNGNITTNDNCTRRIDSNCKYKCNDGFKANPNISTVTCEDTGQWERNISSLCQVYNCPANITNGRLGPACQRTVGEKCNYSCIVTFHPNASIPGITCKTSGWEPDVDALCIEQDRGILVSFPETDQLTKGDFYVIPTTEEGMPIMSHSLVLSFPINQQVFSMAADYGLKHLLVYSHIQNGILLNHDFEMGLGGSRTYELMHIGISSRYVKLAVDWVSHNIYWTDPTFNWIIMQNEMLTDLELYTVVIQRDIEAPHGLAVDPITGFLFWSDIGSVVKIERSNLVGENRTELFTSNLAFPISLVVDHESNSLYWVDSIRETVEVCTYNGSNRRILMKDVSRKFLDVTILHEVLYVTDYAQKILLYMNKTKDVSYLGGIRFTHSPAGVVAYHPDVQPSPSKAVSCPANCSDICVELPDGHRCLCKEGYFYNESTNRCEENLGMFHRGILISNTTSICVLDIRTLATQYEYPLQCFLDAGNVTFMAMNMAERRIFFANSTGIYYASVDSSKIIQLLPLTNDISGLSLDWIDHNIYWSEKTTGTINAMSLNTRLSTTIVSNVTQPREVLVVSHHRKMFWISGRDNYAVQVSNLRGDVTSTISTSPKSSEPHSLVFNPLSQVLFWVEGQMIKSYDLNTNLTKTNVTFSTNVTLLCSYKYQLIWTSDTLKSSVLSAYDLKSKVNRSVIAPVSDIGHIRAMMFFDPTLQPNEKGPCDEFNGLCEQLCIPRGSGRVCRCGAGYTLRNETLCISDPVGEKFLLVSDWTHHKIYQLDLSTNNIHAIDALFTKSPSGIAYHPRLKRLFWGSFDFAENFIATAFLNGSNEEVLVDIYPDDIYPDQIAIDFSTGNIFFTAPAHYWSVGSRKGYIGVLSSDGQHSRKLKLELDQVFDLVLHPKKGLMFWTLGGSSGCICRANMDGTNNVSIVSTSRSTPYGLTIDYKDNILYWTDWLYDRISSVYINGSFPKVLYQDDWAYMGDIVFGGGYLYYTAWNRPHITRLNLTNATDVIRLFDHGVFGTLEGLAIYIGEEQPVNSLCANNNGNCSTFCLPTANGRSCTCSDGVVLLSDGLTCPDAIQCPDRVRGGNISDLCTRRVGSFCGFVCDSGYKPSTNVSLLECKINRTNGVWSNMYPCEGITCPSSVPNTVISPNCSLFLGTNCTYTCQSGYDDAGPGHIVCVNDSKNGSKWSVDSPCKGITCPSSVPNTVISPNCSLFLGTNCTYTCQSGYDDAGPGHIVCVNDSKNGSKWSVDSPCKGITCPSSVPNTVISPNCSLFLGTNCTYTCQSGYDDAGPGHIVCVNDSKNGSKWSVDSPCKGITCPSSVPNTVISPNCSLFLGTNCTYTCQSGYDDAGPGHIVCVNDSKNGSKWSVDSPCKGITCPSSVPNTVISPKCSLLLGTNCTYTCESGYHDEGPGHIRCVNDSKNGSKWSVDTPCKAYLADNTKNQAHSDSSQYGATVGVPVIIVVGIIIVVVFIFTRRCRRSFAQRKRLKEEDDVLESTQYQDFSFGTNSETYGVDSAYIIMERDNVAFHSGGSGHEPEETVRSASDADSGPVSQSIQDSDVSVSVSDKKPLQSKESNA